MMVIMSITHSRAVRTIPHKRRGATKTGTLIIAKLMMRKINGLRNRGAVSRLMGNGEEGVMAHAYNVYDAINTGGLHHGQDDVRVTLIIDVIRYVHNTRPR